MNQYQCPVSILLHTLISMQRKIHLWMIQFDFRLDMIQFSNSLEVLKCFYLWKQCFCMLLQYSLCISWYGSLRSELLRALSVSHDSGHGSRFSTIAAAMPFSWGGMIWAPFAQYTLNTKHWKINHTNKTWLQYSLKIHILKKDLILYLVSIVLFGVMGSCYHDTRTKS